MSHRLREALMTLSAAATVTCLVMGLLANPQSARADDDPTPVECTVMPMDPSSASASASASEDTDSYPCVACF